MKYTYKIRSKSRFSFFLMFITALMIFLCIVIAKGFMSAKYTYEGIAKIEVSMGDTLWNIASRSLPKDRDIRDYINEIIKINQLNSVNIIEGQQLNIPIYSDPSSRVDYQYLIKNQKSDEDKERGMIK